MSRESIFSITKSNIVLPGSNIDQDISQFIDIVNNAIWIVDAQFRLTAQNKAADDLIGRSADDTVGTSIYDLIQPSQKESRSVLFGILDRAMKEGQAVALTEVILLDRKRARPVLVTGKVAPILEDRHPIGAICSFWEISPEKDEAYLKFEFANMASHLMRTPLSFIQASLEFLMSSELETQQQKKILGQMWSQGQRLTRFTQELLKILRLETEGLGVHIEAVELLPLVERLLDLIQSEKPRHIFHLKKIDTSPIIAADPVKVELVLLNLLLNAVRRCPTEGCITIEVEICAAEVIISITDDGEPIPTELLGKVFWPFYPVDGAINKMPSTYNLGLYNTKRLIELQNGRIWAESHRGQNSQFSFSLPILERRK